MVVDSTARDTQNDSNTRNRERMEQAQEQAPSLYGLSPPTVIDMPEEFAGDIVLDQEDDGEELIHIKYTIAALLMYAGIVVMALLIVSILKIASNSKASSSATTNHVPSTAPTILPTVLLSTTHSPTVAPTSVVLGHHH